MFPRQAIVYFVYAAPWNSSRCAVSNTAQRFSIECLDLCAGGGWLTWIGLGLWRGTDTAAAATPGQLCLKHRSYSDILVVMQAIVFLGDYSMNKSNQYQFITYWRVQRHLSEISDILGDTLTWCVGGHLFIWMCAEWKQAMKMASAQSDQICMQRLAAYTLRWQFRLRKQTAIWILSMEAWGILPDVVFGRLYGIEWVDIT